MLRIKFLRLSHGKSQWELGRKAGMSQGRYSMLERGLVEPTPEERDRLAKILEASPSTLLRPAFRQQKAKEELVANVLTN